MKIVVRIEVAYPELIRDALMDVARQIDTHPDAKWPRVHTNWLLRDAARERGFHWKYTLIKGNYWEPDRYEP